MKFRLNKKNAVLAGVNILMLAAAGILTASASSEARSHTYNYAAERWDSTGEYSQISCFFSDEAEFTVDSAASLRMQILNSLKMVSVVPQQGQKLCPDGWSDTVGQYSVRGEAYGRSEAVVTAVGGDFFLIHNFTLLDGAFFSDEDIMQDGIVIDRNLAWSLYGSWDIAGMSLTIGNTEYYISGVIEVPETDEERACAGDIPRAYVSYDGASLLLSGETGAAETFRSISCYEVIMPDPVENFAYELMSGCCESYAGNAEAVCNTGRFDTMRRLKALKSMKTLGVRESGVEYNYRENASRIAEYELSYMYLWRLICLIIPAVTAVWITVRGFRKIKGYILKAVKFMADRIEENKSRKWREKNEKNNA